MGNFTPCNTRIAHRLQKSRRIEFLRLDMADFPANEVGLIGSDDVPLLTTSSAELIYQQLSRLKRLLLATARWGKEAWVT
ncbi:hypothetical protein LAD77_01240 [Klebsiella pneumoniae]|nr:hypothetical protein [Klebsiella pneumoniae]